jgi:hypothetical protein
MICRVHFVQVTFVGSVTSNDFDPLNLAVCWSMPSASTGKTGDD